MGASQPDVKIFAEEPLLSPRLSALREALEAGSIIALEAFWQEVASQGTPLIEPLEGDETHRLVTFLWRAREETRNVVVAGWPVGWNFSRNQMTQLLETDVWYKTYRLRSDMRTTYRLGANDSLQAMDGEEALGDAWDARMGTFQMDPLNLRTAVFAGNEQKPEDAIVLQSVLELPGASPQPWIVPHSGVPKGTIEMHHLVSKILHNRRSIWVYTPPGYTPDAEPYGLLVLFDGEAYLKLIPTHTILDNLLAAGQLPPLVAVLVDNIDHKTRVRELSCYPPFVDFLTEELLPWMHKRYYVTLDPARTIVGGSSAGGLAAAFAGLQASHVFGNVLSQSGAFWWNWDAENKIVQEWLTRQIAISPTRSIRFYIDAGLLERIPNVDVLLANRHLRDVLQAKGYDVHYAEFNGGHEYLSWRGTLSDGLLALLGKS